MLGNELQDDRMTQRARNNLSADSERIECYEQVGAKHGRPYLKDLWVPVLSTVYANTVRCFCDRLFSVVMATAAWTCVMLLQPSAVRECVNSVWRWMPDKELACVTQCYVIAVTFTFLNKISQYVVSIMSSVAVFLCHQLPTAVWYLAHFTISCDLRKVLFLSSIAWFSQTCHHMIVSAKHSHVMCLTSLLAINAMHRSVRLVHAKGC